ncbi:MAG: hypothetical protein Ct9H300mP11_09770 [Chloroflexota bacterium]|nr:MAG: hypothetical protein Ct9H300mP11_09770 [Chloroflexota bacterium]
MTGLDDPGSYRIQNNYFKLHACCLYNHPVLDGVQIILNRDKIVADDVVGIRVEAPPLAMIMTHPEPVNMLSAKFSLPYAVATAVVYNSTDIKAFYPDRLQDPETLDLSRRVEIVANPQMETCVDMTIQHPKGCNISERWSCVN